MRPTDEEIERLRRASGEVNDDRPLVTFVYLLLRDGLPAGDVEALVLRAARGGPRVFTNGWLATYAQDIVDRLT